MVDHAEQQNNLRAALERQIQDSHTVQNLAQLQNTEQIITAINRAARAHENQINTMSQVQETARGSASKL